MTKLDSFFRNEFFITRPLLRTDDFIKYCKDRGIKTSKEQLECFERLGIFYPFVRIQYPKIKIKIEYINDGKQYKYLGVLKDGEQWTGDIREEYAQFSFEKEYGLNWISEGYLWDPLTRPFQDWKTFRDGTGYRIIESFYSSFQCYELNYLLNSMQATISPEQVLKDDFDAKIQQWAKNKIEQCKAVSNQRIALSYICQVLANRYFPQTQTDQRTINITKSGLSYHDWDWYAYCRAWDAKAALNDLGIDISEIDKLQKMILRRAEFIDPLEKWYELVVFISNEKKKKLKGDALFAQTLYSMEHMLRLFYKDLTDKELPMPNESSYFDRKNFYGEGVVENELKYLEFIVNQYNLNPRPRLILVLEGNGEEEQLPRLAKELLGFSLSALGIEVINIQGIGNFEGKKFVDKHGAWERFIDYYHNRQTIVFVILDNEGRVAGIKQKLITAQSKFYSKRYVTKDEYIHLWQKNIEFDNFGHAEIAGAMTELGENKYQFTEEEIKQAENNFGRVKNPLGQLFFEKLNYEIDKPEFLKLLSSFVISNGKNEFDQSGRARREVVRVLMNVVELAGKNYQPITKDTWEKNQASGWFGNLIRVKE